MRRLLFYDFRAAHSGRSIGCRIFDKIHCVVDWLVVKARFLSKAKKRSLVELLLKPLVPKQASTACAQPSRLPMPTLALVFSRR